MTSFILLNDGSSKLLLADGTSSLVLEGHIPAVVVAAETPVIGKPKKKVRMFARQQAQQPEYKTYIDVITFSIPITWSNTVDIGMIIPTQKESKISKKLSTYNISESITPLTISVYNHINTKINSMLTDILSIPLPTDFSVERRKGLKKLRRLVQYGQ